MVVVRDHLINTHKCASGQNSGREEDGVLHCVGRLSKSGG